MALDDDHVPKLTPMIWPIRVGPIEKAPHCINTRGPIHNIEGWLLINCKSVFDREPSKAQGQLLDLNYSTEVYLRV